MGWLIGVVIIGCCDYGCCYGDSNSGLYFVGQYVFDGSIWLVVDFDLCGWKVLVCNGLLVEFGIYDGLQDQVCCQFD